MEKTAFALVAGIAIILSILSGCASDSTIEVNIYVHEKDGPSAKGASVNAYSDFSFRSASGTEKWLSLDGTIEASRDTDDSGTASMSLVPGQYAFFARLPNGHFGGTEQFISANGERVEITLSGG